MPKTPDLSIIILNYNTKDLLKDCLSSLEKVRDEANFEVIVVDNGSLDGSQDFIKRYTKLVNKYAFILNETNLGFAAGNNTARKFAHGKYVLFLNTDTLVPDKTLFESIHFMEGHNDVGAMICKLILGNGRFDRDTRRSFITPWVGLTHLILRLDRVFPKSRLFAKYWYGYIPEDVSHEVDVIEGAYFFARRNVLDEVGWFDESYFLDGENIDLCWRIKNAGYKIMYYPKVSITHFKGLTKGKVESANKRSIPTVERLRFRMAGVDSMEIFYRKWLWSKYPLLVNILVVAGIKFIKAVRFLRTLILG